MKSMTQDRQQLIDELSSIADRYRHNNELKSVSAILYTICAVLEHGNIVALMNYVIEYSVRELSRMRN